MRLAGTTESESALNTIGVRLRAAAERSDPLDVLENASAEAVQLRGAISAALRESLVIFVDREDYWRLAWRALDAWKVAAKLGVDVNRNPDGWRDEDLRPLLDVVRDQGRVVSDALRRWLLGDGALERRFEHARRLRAEARQIERRALQRALVGRALPPSLALAYKDRVDRATHAIRVLHELGRELERMALKHG